MKSMQYVWRIVVLIAIVLVVVDYDSFAQDTDVQNPDTTDPGLSLKVSSYKVDDSLSFVIEIDTSHSVASNMVNENDTLWLVCSYYDTTNNIFVTETSLRIFVNQPCDLPNRKYDTRYQLKVYQGKDTTQPALFHPCVVEKSEKDVKKQQRAFNLRDFLFGSEAYGQCIYWIQFPALSLGLFFWLRRAWPALRSRNVLLGALIDARLEDVGNNDGQQKNMSKYDQYRYDCYIRGEKQRSINNQSDGWEFIDKVMKRQGSPVILKTPFRNKLLVWLAPKIDVVIEACSSPIKVCRRSREKFRAQEKMYLSDLRLYHILWNLEDFYKKKKITTSEVEYIIDNETDELRQQSHVEYIWAIAFTAPLIGLFGTILGLGEAFAEVRAKAGGGAPVIMKAISDGIHDALSTTFVGLGIAIIFMFVYYHYNHKIERIATSWHTSVSEYVRSNITQDTEQHEAT